MHVCISAEVVCSPFVSRLQCWSPTLCISADVVCSINGVKVTDVEMAAQVIKLTAGKVRSSSRRGERL